MPGHRKWRELEVNNNALRELPPPQDPILLQKKKNALQNLIRLINRLGGTFPARQKVAIVFPGILASGRNPFQESLFDFLGIFSTQVRLPQRRSHPEG